jgi:uncharacterized protein (DUF2249 family)
VAHQAAAWQQSAAVTLDVRPELAAGGEPFVRIMEAAATIQPGQALVIIAPFEPVPLYGALAGRGFTHETECIADDEWVIKFTRG